MAECVEGSGFKDQKDEAYLRFSEDKFRESKGKEKVNQPPGAANPVLTAILDRLECLESDRNQGAVGGGVSTNPPANPSPSDLAQLSDSIHQLSMSVHTDLAPKAGIELRPEYYVYMW